MTEKGWTPGEFILVQQITAWARLRGWSLSKTVAKLRKIVKAFEAALGEPTGTAATSKADGRSDPAVELAEKLLLEIQGGAPPPTPDPPKEPPPPASDPPSQPT